MVLIFSEGKLINEFTEALFRVFRTTPYLPHDSYIFDTRSREWYRSDFTPVLLVDVPPNYRAMVLIYT